MKDRQQVGSHAFFLSLLATIINLQYGFVMKKNKFLLAAAVILMASCANDDFTGDNTTPSSGTGAITFNMSTPAITRAMDTGSNAATKLGNEFIVWGEKNENAENAAITTLVGNTNVVFENYRVQYTSDTANTSTSNTKGWEYVGLTPYNANGTTPTEGYGNESNASVSPSIYKDTSTKQTIKYWDFGKTYTFTAISALQKDITSGKVKITKNVSQSTATDKGYTIQLAKGATIDKIYFADRMTKKLDSKNATAAANDAVTLTFRNLMSKIRFGIYETVPGYKVVITGIKFGTTTNTASSDTKTFGIEANNIVAGSNTSYTVTYDNNNKAQVSAATGSSTANVITTAGTTWLTTTGGIATSSDNPTWDNVSNGASVYTTILPNPGNTTPMKLQIAFKLVSKDTREVIEFKNGDQEVYRTVEVPAQYCQWKSNYAYSYIFKISDRSADLYPITFDACVVTEQTGNQETITEAIDPSITTMGVKDGTIVTGKNEYEAGSAIYASVVEKGSDDKYNTVTLSNAAGSTNIALYEVSAAAGFDLTEASVAHAIANASVDNKKITCTKIDATTTDSEGQTITNWSIVTEVPDVDGTNRNVSALKWTGTAGKTYAVEYTSNSKKYYKLVKIATGD